MLSDLVIESLLRSLLALSSVFSFVSTVISQSFRSTVCFSSSLLLTSHRYLAIIVPTQVSNSVCLSCVCLLLYSESYSLSSHRYLAIIVPTQLSYNSSRFTHHLSRSLFVVLRDSRSLTVVSAHSPRTRPRSSTSCPTQTISHLQ